MERVYRKETRGEAGVRLYRERGGEIVYYLDGTFGVPSRSEEGLIRVVALADAACDCPDHSRRGRVCAHLVAAEMKHAERRAKRRAKRGSLLERFRHELMDDDERLELAGRLGVGA